MFNTFFRTGLRRTLGKYGLSFATGLTAGFAIAQSDRVRSFATSAYSNVTSFFKRFTQQPEKGKKVVLIGAGKVGLETLRNILADPSSFSSVKELVVLNTNPNKVKGFLMDWNAAYHSPIYVKPTDQQADMKDADLVVITAGLWTTKETKEEFHKVDPSGRLVQSFTNKPLVQNLCEAVKHYAPGATVVVVTNQLDMMTEVAREALPDQTVVGIGNMLDTLRFKRVLADILFKNGRLSDANANRIDAFVVGYHNNHMFLLRENLKIDGKAVGHHDKELQQFVQQAMDETIVYGKKVSDLQKDKAYPNKDSGSSILPGLVVAQSIQAFASPTTKLIAPFNIRLPENLAQHFGLSAGESFGVPVVIGNGKVTPLSSSDYEVTNEEKQGAIKANKEFNQCMRTLTAQWWEPIHLSNRYKHRS